ncbi:MAG: hypothetical protein ACRDL5_15630 [Solirubrobacteraceae bacterium]
MRSGSRIAQLALAALAGAALTGGGLALASSGSRTIHGCVVRRTHQLLIQRRCTRSETRLTWNQRGPTGPAGRTGATGPQAVGAWGLIGENESAAFVTSGQNLAATRTGVGTVSVTITGGPCADEESAVVVSPNTAARPGAQLPVAYTTGTAGASSFTLNLGTLIGGAFTPQDGIVGADVAVYCSP